MIIIVYKECFRSKSLSIFQFYISPDTFSYRLKSTYLISPRLLDKTYNTIKYLGSIHKMFVLCSKITFKVCNPPNTEPRYPNQFEAEPVSQNKKEEEEEIPLEVEAATIPLCLEKATQQLAESRLQTDSLLQRIEDLSGKIRSGLNLVETTGTTVSELPVTITASDIGGNLHDVITTSSHTAGDGEEVGNSEGDETLSEHCASEPDEIERDRERGVTSPEGPEVDPKLAKALEKMKKLDKRLADVVMVCPNAKIFPTIHMTCVYLTLDQPRTLLMRL